MATTTLAATLNTPLSELRPATMDRILVIADDSALRKALQRLFSLERYEVEVVTDSVTGLARLRERPFSAVILDLQRPGSSGWDLCRNIADSGLPLVVLSASPDVADKVLLLEMGADDYLTIPFSSRELVARLRALMRRASRISPESLYVFEDVIVDFSKTEITRGGEKVTVTAKEFKTLEFLAKNAERVISRDELLNEVWGYQNYPCTRTVDNHILRLRQKLESDPSHPSHLLTVHGMGYKLVP
ncbi:MAG TPA: response regulator transcription factor [Candidatus Acidoferrum sp.]|nr:response regulator transcription factor [Candidatus Acidoferrum sp.]